MWSRCKSRSVGAAWLRRIRNPASSLESYEYIAQPSGGPHTARRAAARARAARRIRGAYSAYPAWLTQHTRHGLLSIPGMAYSAYPAWRTQHTRHGVLAYPAWRVLSIPGMAYSAYLRGVRVARQLAPEVLLLRVEVAPQSAATRSGTRDKPTRPRYPRVLSDTSCWSRVCCAKQYQDIGYNRLGSRMHWPLECTVMRSSVSSG